MVVFWYGMSIWIALSIACAVLWALAHRQGR